MGMKKFQCGDLVQVVFPRNPGMDRSRSEKVVGIFMHYQAWADDIRALVFWDGEDISTPVCQLKLVRKVND